jgi:hypothetical protein
MSPEEGPSPTRGIILAKRDLPPGTTGNHLHSLSSQWPWSWRGKSEDNVPMRVGPTDCPCSPPPTHAHLLDLSSIPYCIGYVRHGTPMQWSALKASTRRPDIAGPICEFSTQESSIVLLMRIVTWTSNIALLLSDSPH